MKMSNEEYGKYVKKNAPKSPLGKDMALAFVFGGLICCVGQAVLELWQYFGLSKEDAATATSITMVFLGALLTGLGVYDNIAKLAGAGTLVPITGFANSVVAPALEFKTEGFITGTAVKIFTIAGPVIVFGTVSSVVYGFLYLLL
ncbi:MAG: stage V sporulation protein AC [Oscillospiraceae bacterium]|nr:stage V sporulation protein AC [Oscillospiraceae bacterium]MBR5262085.1 stage V sporulation protein AC [Oscillospiraceae bacterium]